MIEKNFTTGILGEFSKIDAEKVKELQDYLNSNKIEEKMVFLRLEIGDLIFIPKSLRYENTVKAKIKKDSLKDFQMPEFPKPVPADQIMVGRVPEPSGFEVPQLKCYREYGISEEFLLDFYLYAKDGFGNPDQFKAVFEYLDKKVKENEAELNDLDFKWLHFFGFRTDLKKFFSDERIENSIFKDKWRD